MQNAIGFLAEPPWIAELAIHFKPLYLIFSLLCLAVFLRTRYNLWKGIAVLSIVLNGMAILPFYWPPPVYADKSEPTQFTLLQSNVNFGNTNYAQILAMIRQSDADIVVLQEVNSRLAVKLKELKSIYPQQILFPREGAFGIGLLTRLPVLSSKLIHPGSPYFPAIRAVVTVEGNRLEIIASHPPPPITAEFFEIRNRQLKALAGEVKAFRNPGILAGDLNITPWSPYFEQLLKETGLLDVRQGLGFFGTWPTPMQIIGLPIDHVLISKTLYSIRLQQDSLPGSDHAFLLSRIGFNRVLKDSMPLVPHNI